MYVLNVSGTLVALMRAEKAEYRFCKCRHINIKLALLYLIASKTNLVALEFSVEV